MTDPPDVAGPTPTSPPAARIHHRIGRVAADYIRFAYTGKFATVYRHLRSLPSQESWVTHAALTLAGLLVVATPLLLYLGARLQRAPFESVGGEAASLPTAALYLTLLAFAAGWGYLLSGGAQGPGLLWVFIGAEYFYLVVLVGLTVGRTYLHVVPLLLPIVIGALTPGVKWGGQAALAILAGSLATHITPLARIHGVPWFVLWPPTAVVLFGVHALLARHAPPSAAARTMLASLVTAAYLVMVAAIARNPGELATWLNVSLNSAIALLALLWFTMGASFVEGAFHLAEFASKALETIAAERMLDRLILVGWVSFAGWTIYQLLQQPSQGRIVVAGALLALIAILIVRWRVRGLNREWLAGWFVGSIATVIALRAYTTHDIRALLRANADVLSLAGFIYATVWEVASEVRFIPLSAAGFRRPSPLLLYLGAVLLISAAALFAIAGRLAFFQEIIVLQEYQGAISLWIPIALLTAARTWRLLAPDATRRCVHAFFWGAILAVPGFLLRSMAAHGVADGVVLAAIALAVVALVQKWPEAADPLQGAAVGCAAALGVAVSLCQRVLVEVVPDVLNMLASLSGILVLREWVTTIRAWTQHAAWGPSEQVVYYLAAPALALLTGVLVILVRQKLQPKPAVAASHTGG